MANTLIKTMNIGNGHIYVFEATSTGTTEALQLPAGKTIVVPMWPSYVSGGTPTATTTSYVRATGVLTVSGLTASNNVVFAVLTD